LLGSGVDKNNDNPKNRHLKRLFKGTYLLILFKKLRKIPGPFYADLCFLLILISTRYTIKTTENDTSAIPV